MQVPESVAFSFVAGVNPIVGLHSTFFLVPFALGISLTFACQVSIPALWPAAHPPNRASPIILGSPQGFITGAIGGKPAMISGAAGAMAVVIKDLMDDNGPLKEFSTADRFEQLLMCVLLTGVLQTLCGCFQLAKLVRLIPQPAMLGFMNGLAIVIFMAQFSAFKECNSSVYSSASGNDDNPE